MFQNSFNYDRPPWWVTLLLPIYALTRPRASWQLFWPFLRHPATVLRNVSRWRRPYRDSFEGICVGTSSRAAFLAEVEDLGCRWQRGELPSKPQLWVFQSYCQKPSRCACSPTPNSRYTKAGRQRRFNEFCMMEESGGAGVVCNHGQCRIGSTLMGFGQGEGRLDVQLKIMLDERQMAEYWTQMLEWQACTRMVIPFVMEVCPFAYHLARRSLFHLKSPLGIVFFFSSENRCHTFRQYLSADKGGKDPETPVGLGGETRSACDELLQQILWISQGKGIEQNTTTVP